MSSKLGECKKEVAKNAKVCPHCGEKNPTTLTGDVVKGFVIIAIIIMIIIGMSSDDETTTSNTNQTQSAKWYENGNLHKSTIKEWKQSTKENQIATSADWVLIASKTIKAKVENSGNVDTVKPYAIELVKCMNEATQGIDTVDHQQSTEHAIMCMTLMGWLK